MAEPRVLMVHPGDVSVAEVKAIAAQYDVSVVANQWTPRGQMFLMRDVRNMFGGAED